MILNDPIARELAATADAQLAAELKDTLSTGDTPLAFGLCLRLISGDFDELERYAIPGERELRRSIHEIIDAALRGLILADDGGSDLWRRLVLPDEFGLFECNMLMSNARWLRICGSKLVDSNLEALDARALASCHLSAQARALARFCLVNDGATPLDYASLAAVLDPRLLPFFHDWLTTVHYLSPTRIDDSSAAAHQEAALAALLAARRAAHDALPASSNQSGPAFRAPYVADANTRAHAVEFNGRQMAALMRCFAPSDAEVEELNTSILDTTALGSLPGHDELVICPNWHADHVIFRCMSPLIEGMRKRGAPLLRVFPKDAPPPPAATAWSANTIDVPHHPTLALAHLGAIDRTLGELDFKLAFFPEIVPANSSSWMATERLARVQATGYGFPVTSGLNTIDYFIGGTEVERRGAEDDYVEQLILLPGLGVSTTEPPAPSAERRRPVDAALDPADPLRVVSTTSQQKLNRELLATWDALFAAHPGARLDLFTNMTPAQIELYAPALTRMLSRGEVTLHCAQPRQTILDALQEADLYLDAFPYGGFNSLVEPLSVGCPVLTVEGQRARNRLGAALVRRAGLPETMISRSLDEYTASAARLLTDAGERYAMRAALGTRKDVIARLADADLSTHMDAALSWMCSRGPRKHGSRSAPILIRAGEKPVSVPA
jgi:hypothetical protein